MASFTFHSRFIKRAGLGCVVIGAVLFATHTSKKSEKSTATPLETAESSSKEASAPLKEEIPDRLPISEPPTSEATREKTFAKFSELYGKKSPLIEPLFEWAILGFRSDRGSPEFAEERKKVLTELNRDPAATLALLTSGQEKFPADWGVVRNSLVNLVGQLDVPHHAKAEFLSNEILRAPRLVDENGEGDADSFALATAIDYLSRVGSASDARKILESLRGSRDRLSKAQLEFVLTRMAAYFPEVTAPYTQELLGPSPSN